MQKLFPLSILQQMPLSIRCLGLGKPIHVSDLRLSLMKALNEMQLENSTFLDPQLNTGLLIGLLAITIAKLAVYKRYESSFI
jgi:hypothetical protein